MKAIKDSKILYHTLRYVLITIASFAYAVGISLFLDPNNLAPGGVSGIAIILNRVISVPTGTLLFVLNIPIMLLGIWKFGWRFIVSTLYCILVSSWFIDFLSVLEPVTNDPLLAAIAGSVLQAVGIAVVFKCGSTTGGTDIIIKVLRLRFKHLKTGVLFFLTDVVIVAASGFVFKDFNTAMYAGIAIIVNSVGVDAVLYGPDEAKLIYIISSKHLPIAERLMEELDVGATYLTGEGAYTHDEKQVIMCVTKKQMAPRAQEIVKQEDPSAFMIITRASEIYGEGYKDFGGDIL